MRKLIVKRFKDGLDLAGARYWAASLGPALVGTTLPFWLQPPNYSFRLFAAFEFHLAALLMHSGYALLLTWYEGSSIHKWSKVKTLISAMCCIGSSSLIGFHLHHNLGLHAHVFEGLFLVYGVCVLLVGVLYVVPPVNFYRRAGGEIVITYSLGLLPLLGAYLVQVGDITRTVYLASLPIVVITGLWVWIDEIIKTFLEDNSERDTLVRIFGIRTSSQIGVLSISILYFFSILLAAFTGSVNPLALLLLLLIVPMGIIVNRTWRYYQDLDGLKKTRKSAVILHLTTCVILAISSMNWISIHLPSIT